MLRNQEPDRNIEDLTDEEIYSAIHYLEEYSQPNEEQEDGGGIATAIILLVLTSGIVAFIWFYR